MEKKLNLQELTIVIVARNHNPTILNPDFLKYNGIVPDSWELSEGIVSSDLMSRVAYKNGISIIAQLDKLILTEALGDKTDQQIQGPTIVLKYVESLPKVDYRAAGINVRGHVKTDSQEEAQGFVSGSLITEGPWKTYQGQAPIVGVQFRYPREDGALTIRVDDSEFAEDDNTTPCLLFASNFHHDIQGNPDERVGRVKEVILSWKSCLDTFRSLVAEVFLKEEDHNEPGNPD